MAVIAVTAAAAWRGTLTGKAVLVNLPERLTHVLLHTAMIAGGVFIMLNAVW